MDISCLMVHAQQVEESRLKRKIRAAKRAKSYEGGISKRKLEIQDKPKFKKRFSNQVPSNIPKYHNDRVSNPRFKKERGGDSPSEKPTCGKYGKKHVVELLVGTNNCFGCGKSGHKVRDCPIVKGQGKGNKHAQARGPSSNTPKKNRFYALISKGDQEASPDVLTGMLQAFSINVYALLDPGANLCLVTPIVAMKFDVLHDVLNEPFSVTTQWVTPLLLKESLRVVPYYFSIELHWSIEHGYHK
ncbi:uncharacterized protein [Solanum lycopersicum]|uniref:uncharacterized protein n=1 Tax=Solanum lycopersicum TaxID=4081 RepID=UPI003749C4DB